MRQKVYIQVGLPLPTRMKPATCSRPVVLVRFSVGLTRMEHIQDARSCGLCHEMNSYSGSVRSTAFGTDGHLLLPPMEWSIC
jgi:hypothetical protein